MSRRSSAGLCERFVLVVVLAAGCAHPQPWKARRTAETTFEGERLAVSTGYEVQATCDDDDDHDHDYPMFPCAKSADRLHRSKITWGARTIVIPLAIHTGSRTPGPLIRRVRARRSSAGLFALQLSTKAAPHDHAWFMCLDGRSSELHCEGVALRLDSHATTADARRAAIEARWAPSRIASYFGPSPEVYEYMLARSDLHALDRSWPELDAHFKERAFTAAAVAGDTWLIEKHWVDLDIAMRERLVAAVIQRGAYFDIFGIDRFWAALSYELRRHVIETISDKALSLDNNWRSHSKRSRFVELVIEHGVKL